MKQVLTGEVLKAVECDRQDYNNWRKRIFEPLAARLPEIQEMPAAREPITKFTALMIGFVSAMVKVGFDPSEAADRAHVYAGLNHLGKMPKWLISFPGTEDIHCGDKGAEKAIVDAFARDVAGASQWDDEVPLSTSRPRAHVAARIVNLGEICARIDDLFAPTN